MQDTKQKITIITPCLNARGPLLQTLENLAQQRGSFCLEHFVVDGASSDGTANMLRTHEGILAGWISEPDENMYAAIVKGFDRTDGEIMGWLNAGDLLVSGALETVGSIFRDCPDVAWITTQSPVSIDAAGHVLRLHRLPGFSRQAFLDGVYIGEGGLGDPCATGFIQQESTFWRRSLWERAKGRDALLSQKLAGDFALWSAFFTHARLAAVESPLGCFRIDAGQKSRLNRNAYMAEVQGILSTARHAAKHAPTPLTGNCAVYSGHFVQKKAPFLADSPWMAEMAEFGVLATCAEKKWFFAGRLA